MSKKRPLPTVRKPVAPSRFRPPYTPVITASGGCQGMAGIPFSIRPRFPPRRVTEFNNPRRRTKNEPPAANGHESSRMEKAPTSGPIAAIGDDDPMEGRRPRRPPFRPWFFVRGSWLKNPRLARRSRPTNDPSPQARRSRHDFHSLRAGPPSASTGNSQAFTSPKSARSLAPMEGRRPRRPSTSRAPLGSRRRKATTPATMSCSV